jgi:hypothetical protein
MKGNTWMHSTIPAPVQPLLEAYLRALEPLSAHFYGLYLYGSIALGAYEEAVSDIDVIALTQGEWSPQELKQLAQLHEKLIQEYEPGRRLEVIYVPVSSLGESRREAGFAPYPGVHDGRFWPSGFGDVNGVTWWILKHRGVCLLGVEREQLPFDYPWQQVLLTMRFNLDVYFAGKLKHPYIYLSPLAVEFAVSNLCRILSTIEDGEIVSKSASLKIWRQRLPPRWQRLLDEAWRLRHHPEQPSLYRFPWARMRDMLAFIRYVRKRGGKVLDASGLFLDQL